MPNKTTFLMIKTADVVFSDVGDFLQCEQYAFKRATDGRPYFVSMPIFRFVFAPARYFAPLNMTGYGEFLAILGGIFPFLSF